VDAWINYGFLKRYRVVPEPLKTSQVDFLRRAAKKLARAEGILHSHALDRLAKEHGYKNWSLLQKNSAPNPEKPHDQPRPDEVPELSFERLSMSKLSQQKVRVLDAFESRTDDWSTGEFENALEISMGKNYKNYQDAKMTIIEADKDGRWPRTVRQYLTRNFKAFGNLPAEMNPIGQRLGLFGDTNKKS
jgi:hypothetical protein